jgi:LPS export ABC transporter protein LptC
MSSLWTAHLRRAALWAIPAVLVAALIWSALPRGGGEQVTPPKFPAAPQTEPSRPPSARGGASGPTATATPQRPSSGVASGEIKLGNLVGTDEQGHMRWQILADDMMLGQAQQTVALKHVRATFFGDDGTRMLVNGDRGTYDTRTREVTVGGDVHGVTSTGRELYADTVYYSPQSRQVEGRGHVRVVEERVIMYADSMISDLRLGQTRFFGNVHMTLR